MKRIYFLFFTIMFILSFETNAQEISVNIKSGYGIFTENSVGGKSGSFGIDYLHQLKPKLQTMIGADMNFIPWGMNLTTNFGLKFRQEISPRWNWTLKAQTQQGIATFSQKSLYVFGISGTGGIEFELTSKSTISLCTGIRYTNCPAYSVFGQVYSFWDAPVEIGYRIKIGS